MRPVCRTRAILLHREMQRICDDQLPAAPRARRLSCSFLQHSPVHLQTGHLQGRSPLHYPALRLDAELPEPVLKDQPERTDHVPPENRIWLLDRGFVMASGGSAVFADQPVRYGFPVDSRDIKVDCCDAMDSAFTAGDPLGDALMRPGRAAVDLVLDQNGPQMRLTEDQQAVEELAAQGTVWGSRTRPPVLAWSSMPPARTR